MYAIYKFPGKDMTYGKVPDDPSIEIIKEFQDYNLGKSEFYKRPKNEGYAIYKLPNGSIKCGKVPNDATILERIDDYNQCQSRYSQGQRLLKEIEAIGKRAPSSAMDAVVSGTNWPETPYLEWIEARLTMAREIAGELAHGQYIIYQISHGVKGLRRGTAPAPAGSVIIESFDKMHLCTSAFNTGVLNLEAAVAAMVMATTATDRLQTLLNGTGWGKGSFVELTSTCLQAILAESPRTNEEFRKRCIELGYEPRI